MTGPARRRATYQDVLDAPDDKIAEIVDGVLHLSPWPRIKHQSVTSTLSAVLLTRFQLGGGGPGDWILINKPELHLGDDILVPDIAAWRSERLPEEEEGVALLTIAPDCICEVLSRSTQRFDRGDKMASYAAAGVKHAWLVHPVRRTLEVFRLCRGRWRALATHQGDERVRAEPFEALELDLTLLWHRLAPPPPHRDCEFEETCEVGAAYHPH
jgi:Uma2 family endonuclease